MAHRSDHPVGTGKSETDAIFSSAKGAGASALTTFKGDLTACVRTGTGAHDLTFRHKYPEGMIPIVQVRGTTAGLKARVSAWNAAAGTMSIVLEVGAVATDAAATDFVDFLPWMRNSGRNGY
jgi:hypothetical protein